MGQSLPSAQHGQEIPGSVNQGFHACALPCRGGYSVPGKGGSLGVFDRTLPASQDKAACPGTETRLVQVQCVLVRLTAACL